MNLLFICSRNQWRSPTAEKIFNVFPHYAKSAGTSSSARIKATEKLIVWADLVFVMEKKHRNILHEKFNLPLADKKIIVLGIPDNYQYMDEELVEMLEVLVNPYLLP
ncbi:low molecular weight protein tyrosine phosphatase family protein [Dyadobacter sp. CY312]|uniref:low molecular weight protein tyrosine phosphatase family protein n=1 Tax=Dyadobacter sp. CY312 TaxID=2907303 RepID=UPI001F2F986A|nr:protein tyrosine phosphatase [Dyadobacter sp. CY312]MCE7039439.1 protein tyrosine phosphatase [Dyadobacter sp. CY312]